MRKWFYSLFLLTAAIMLSMQVQAQDPKNIKARLQAGEPLFVVFMGLEAQPIQDLQVVTSQGTFPAPEVMYYQPLAATAEYGKNTIKANFDNSFFSSYNVTDFNAIYLPIGDHALSDNVNGYSIIGTIKSMLDAGKRVFVCGRSWLSKGESNSEVKSFLTNCGISYFATVQRPGNPPAAFTIRGQSEYDTVSRGYLVACNTFKGRNGVGPLQSWFYDLIVETFKISDNKVAYPSFWFTQNHTVDDQLVGGMSPTDTLVGARVYTAKSKLVLLSMGFESACPAGWQTDFEECLWGATNWFMADMPKPNPWLTFSQDPLEFDSVDVNTSSIKEVVIQNFGKKTLLISDIYSDDFNGYGVFELMNTQTSFSLAPMATKKLQVKFTPKQEMRYEDYLTVESNADNGKKISIDLVGYGGGKPKEGPRLYLNTTLVDFGFVKLGSVDTMGLTVTNSGTGLLIVDNMKWVDNAGGAFDFNKSSSQFPLSLDPKQNIEVKFRFVPVTKGVTYKGKLMVIAMNAINADTMYVTFKGSTAEDEPTSILISETKLNFDTVANTTKRSLPLTLTNMGTTILRIDTLEFLNNNDNAFSWDMKYKLEYPIEIFSADPVLDLKIKFVPPTVDKLYTAQLHGTCNAVNNPDFSIDLVGYSRSVGVEDQLQGGISNCWSFPNPANGQTTLSYTISGDGLYNVSIDIVDLLGNKLLSIPSKITGAGVHYEQVNLSNCAQGMYYVSMMANGKMTRLPIVVTK